MKTLDTTFTESGFVFEQIERTGNVAIYRRYKQGGGPEHFEVIRVGHHNGFKIPGTDKTAPPAETYPPASQWGSNGFTLLNITDARAKAAELTEAARAKAADAK